MPSLYYEILACVIAAGVVGLFGGWMMMKKSSRLRISRITKHWENKYTDFVHNSDMEFQDLETKLATLSEELNESRSLNKELRGTVRMLENQSRQAQDEALKTNKATTEAQSRMQQLLHTKASALLAESAKELNAETFDKTVRIAPTPRRLSSIPALDEYDDEPLDATTVLADSSFDTEESTIALDRDTLDALRRSSES